MRTPPMPPGRVSRDSSGPGRSPRFKPPLLAGSLGLILLILAAIPAGRGSGESAVTDAFAGEVDLLAGHLLSEEFAALDLVPGRIIVLASWQCSFLQLERVNELARSMVEEPLDRLMDEGRLVGWGQLNGEFRSDYNYHTYYLADNMAQYRSALGQVLSHVGRQQQAEMEEFYRLCSDTRETAVTVVTARSQERPVP